MYPEASVLKLRCIVPSPSKSGEKVADRPDEGAFEQRRMREKHPHPALSPKSFAASWLRHPSVQCRKRFGGEGTKRGLATKNARLHKASARANCDDTLADASGYK